MSTTTEEAAILKTGARMRRGKQHLAASNTDHTLCGRPFARFLNVRDTDFEEFVRAHRVDCKVCKHTWWPEPHGAKGNPGPSPIVIGLARLT